MSQGKITENQRRNGAHAAYPEYAADEATDGEATGGARRKEQGRRIGVKGGVEFGIEPSTAVDTLKRVVFNLGGAIGTRSQVQIPKSGQEPL